MQKVNKLIDGHCWFGRGEQRCQEPAVTKCEPFLCAFHSHQGATMDESYFYSVKTGQFLSTKTHAPEIDDIKGSSFDNLYVFGGGKCTLKPQPTQGRFRKVCRVCWALRRSKSEYCIRHTKLAGQADVSRSSDSSIACRFFDTLMEQTGWNIIHRHIRHDGVSVGEEFRLRLQDRKLSVDGYVPEQKLIIEFLGDFYHGNPDKYNRDHMNKSRKRTFGDLYDDTYERHKHIAEAGYTIMYVWENDYKQVRDDVKLITLLKPWNDWKMRSSSAPKLYRLLDT